jgi:adenine-specific DNA-methyltransferase
VNSTGDIEAARLIAQWELDRVRPPRQRNRLGQFATPPALANEILRYASTHFGAKPIRFLDPAIGTGAFYSALLGTWPQSRIVRATGFEVDADYGNTCRRLWHALPLEMRLEDFTSAVPPQRESERYNLLVCNPPYVRHHHLSVPSKRRLQHLAVTTSGVAFSGLAGLSAYFMALAHPWMARGAFACWLIPCEFMYVNYGAAIRRYLSERVTVLRIHRFEPTDVQFDDALVTSAIVCFRNIEPGLQHQVELTTGGSMSDPEKREFVPVSTLRGAHKWTAGPTAGCPPGTPVLGDFFGIKRGIATGANRFFIMSPERAVELGIPELFWQPIIPGPKHLESDEIEPDERGWPALSRRLLLIHCDLPEDRVRKRYPTFWRYLEDGRARIANRYLCSRRTPWYSQETRASTYFLCSYIARRRADGRLQRFIFNRSAAIAANSYLMMYPRESVQRFIGGDMTRARAVWRELAKIESHALSDRGRVYGGGLYKLEPRELSAIPAPGLAALMDFAQSH